MTGYWPRSFFASLWTSTSSRSINTQKKNLVYIQPSWPHTWSITHTYRINFDFERARKDFVWNNRKPHHCECNSLHTLLGNFVIIVYKVALDCTPSLTSYSIWSQLLNQNVLNFNEMGHFGRPFYSCVLSYLAYECKSGWWWPSDRFPEFEWRTFWTFSRL